MSNFRVISTSYFLFVIYLLQTGLCSCSFIYLITNDMENVEMRNRIVVCKILILIVINKV